MLKRLALCALLAASSAPLWAQAPAAATRPAGQESMFPLYAIAGIAFLFYFIVMRPQQQDQKKREQEREAVVKGDRAVTIGGIHGTVEAINIPKGTVSLLIAPKVTVEVNKTALATIFPKGRGEAKDAKKDEPEAPQKG